MINKRLAIIFPKDSKGFYDPSQRISFGGATVQLDMISKAVSTKVMRLDLLLPDYHTIANPIINGRGFVQLFKNSDNFLVKAFKTLFVLIKYRPHYIMQRGLTAESPFLSLICRLIGIKYVFMFAHDIELMGYYQNSRKNCFFYPLLLKSSSSLVCQNHHQLSNLDKKYHNKHIIFKKGIPADSIKADSTIEKKYQALWIGRCVKWKNPEMFIDLALRYPDKQFLFLCIKGNDVDYYASILKKVSDIPNITVVTYAEHSKIFSFISQSELLCITSDMEGDCPMTLIESGAMSVPVVAFSKEFNSDIIQYECCLFANNDHDLFLSNFEKVFSSSALYNKMSEGIRMYVETYHDIEKNTNNLLTKLIGN
ncbi:MAG: glycosyltransferase [Spirochaetes bacterium]|jgi:glycosyltransferase involved in cell wall biosynthesis|nr:glycosyltransferase [Spirochaetota bacterium]